MARKAWYLREWREHRGLTLEALAAKATDLSADWGDRAVSLTKSDLSKLERGKRRYNQHQLEALAAALRCDPADLVGFTPEQADEVKRLVAKIVQRGNLADLRVLRAIAGAEDEPESGAA